MYLCEFHYECVLIRTYNCVLDGVLGFFALIILCVTRRTEIRSIAGITSRRLLQRRPLRNG